jgi:anti-sigma regulatory factor (Ser/Thr protein kinase)
VPFTSGGVGTGLSTDENANFEANARSLTFVNTIRVGAEYSFKWRVILLFLIPSLITNLGYDPQRTGSGWVAWIPVAAAAYLASVLTFALAKVIKDRLFPKAGLVYALIWYPLVGFARGIAAYWASLDLGIAAKNDFYFRLISPPIFSVAVLSLLAAIVTTVALQGEASRRLNRENLALRTAIAEFPQIHEQLRLELLERVRAIVQPAVDDIRSKLMEAKVTFDSQRLLNTLRLATDEIIRPLSQEVGTSQVRLELPARREEKVRGTRFLAQRISGDLVVGWGTVLSVTVELAPEAVLRRILNAVMVAALLAVSFYATLWLLNRLVRKIRANSIVVLALILASYALAGVLAPLPWQATRWHLHPDERLVFFLIALSVGLAVGLVEISLAARRSSLLALRETNDKMARLLSQLRRQAWIDRRRVATVLHGPIQGALQSASIRIAGAENLRTELIEQIEHDIEQAMGHLVSYGAADVSFEDVLDDVMAVWEDVVDFRLAFSTESLASLAQSPDASEAAVEVVREGITNAMKHSKPETIWISLTTANANTVRVVIENDGVQLGSALPAGAQDTTQKPGYGATLMSQLAHSWSLNTQVGKAVLTADIVLEPKLSY